MQGHLFESIEEDLNELMVVLSEEEYVAFVESDKLIKIYEIVIDMHNKENILTDEALRKIAKYVNLKLDIYR